MLGIIQAEELEAVQAPDYVYTLALHFAGAERGSEESGVTEVTVYYREDFDGSKVVRGLAYRDSTGDPCEIVFAIAPVALGLVVTGDLDPEEVRENHRQRQANEQARRQRTAEARQAEAGLLEANEHPEEA